MYPSDVHPIANGIPISMNVHALKDLYMKNMSVEENVQTTAVMIIMLKNVFVIKVLIGQMENVKKFVPITVHGTTIIEDVSVMKDSSGI